ncbi:MAG TPA: response regulator [Tepidisphaeraceae bacterium]|nr:response regulator [Tepidisphaeraceae bacterium]
MREPLQGTRPLCILLVEDDADSLAALARLLSVSGHRALAAASAEEALRLAAAERCDLVVSDVGLPDRSGIELMRELSTLYGIPGIAVTGYAEAAHLDECARAGFTRHIKKPVEFPELLLAVNELGGTRDGDGGDGSG